MRRTVEIAREMLERHGWFVFSSRQDIQYYAGEVIHSSIMGDGVSASMKDKLPGPVVVIGDASLEDLNVQAKLMGSPQVDCIPSHCRIYRAVAE